MRCWKANAKNEFDSWSRTYDRSILQRLFFRPSHEKLLANLHLQPAVRVLDIGCGTGLFARRLLGDNPTASVVGLDLSDKMVGLARANCEAAGERIRFVVGDAEHLPFADDVFDAVTCIHSFHHYPHQGSVLREMHRVLKPGGRLFVVDANRDGFWGWIVFDWVVQTIEGLVHHCSARQLRDLFGASGFDTVDQHRGGSVAPFLLTTGVAAKSAQRLPRFAEAA